MSIAEPHRARMAVHPRTIWKWMDDHGLYRRKRAAQLLGELGVEIGESIESTPTGHDSRGRLPRVRECDEIGNAIDCRHRL